MHLHIITVLVLFTFTLSEVINNMYSNSENELINCIKEDLIKALISVDNTLAKQLLTNITKLLQSCPFDKQKNVFYLIKMN